MPEKLHVLFVYGQWPVLLVVILGAGTMIRGYFKNRVDLVHSARSWVLAAIMVYVVCLMVT